MWKKGTALVPSFTAFAVVGLLERYFGDLVDYGFTASMEDDLDAIASGDEESLPWLTRFYFGAAGTDVAGANGEGGSTSGNGAGNGKELERPAADSGDAGPVAGHVRGLGLKREVSTYLGEIDAREINSIPIGLGSDGQEIVARVGRYGPYLQRGEDRVSIPEDLAPDELTVERAEELLEAPSSDRVLGEDPETGLPVQVRAGRFGPYVQLGELVEGGPKPRTSSLFAYDVAGHHHLRAGPRAAADPPGGGHRPGDRRGDRRPQRQVRPLSEARDRHPEPGQPRTRSSRSRWTRRWPCSPSPRPGGRNAKGPLREMGADPDTGLPMVVKDGRFGPYVTDGTTNASLRRGDDVETLTVERAAELLAERRAAGPSTKKKAAKKKAPAKKAAAKKTPAKKTGGQEDAGQEDGGQEGGGEEGRGRTRTSSPG